MYRITYHHKVVDDLIKISPPHKKIIKKAIEERLTTEPQLFGKPLQFSLKGLRSMRAGDYRVVFELTKNEVFIVLIEHRSTVYQTIEKRI
jgi:mRNA interferase RelE/StbE